MQLNTLAKIHFIIIYKSSSSLGQRIWNQKFRCFTFCYGKGLEMAKYYMLVFNTIFTKTSFSFEPHPPTVKEKVQKTFWGTFPISSHVVYH